MPALSFISKSDIANRGMEETYLDFVMRVRDTIKINETIYRGEINELHLDINTAIYNYRIQ